jgi:uncharacterized protein YjdB
MNSKLKRFILCVAVLLAVMGIRGRMTEVQAAEGEKVYIPLNQEWEGEGEKTYYFILPSNGKLTIKSDYRYINIYQGDNLVVGTSYSYGKVCRLPAGEYRITRFGAGILNFTPEAVSNYEQEFNDSFDTANVINPNIAYFGNSNLNYNSNNDVDYYKLNLPSEGSLYLELLPSADISYSIYAEDVYLNTSELDSGSFKVGNDSQISPKLRISAGTYYIKIVGNGYGESDYQFKVVYSQESSTSFETEDNNIETTADFIQPNVEYTGNLQSSGDIDYYKITLPSTGTLKLRLQTPRQITDKLFKVELLQQGENGSLQTIDTLYSNTNPVNFGNEKLLNAGDYYIRVQAGGYSVSDSDTHIDYILQCIYDEQTLVQSVEISSNKTELFTGDIAQLTATISPSNAANKAVKWVSTDTTVVKVDQNGVLTCVAPGEAIVTAKAQDGSNQYGEFHVIVKKRLVTSIDLKAKKSTLEVGEYSSVSATVRPSGADNSSIIWESSNDKVVKVSQKGTIKGLKAGKATIRAIAEDGSGVIGKVVITVKRQKSTSANLKTLKVSKGTLNKKFSYKRTSYVLTLSKNTASVKITPTMASKYATMTINGKKAKSVTVKVAAGKSKTVKIVVTAESGTKKTYTIKVTRKAAKKETRTDIAKSMNEADILKLVKKYQNAPVIKVDGYDGNTMIVHLYEIVGKGAEAHTATWDWLWIDTKTLYAQNFVGDTIDLLKYQK